MSASMVTCTKHGIFTVWLTKYLFGVDVGDGIGHLGLSLQKIPSVQVSCDNVQVKNDSTIDMSSVVSIFQCPITHPFKQGGHGGLGQARITIQLDYIRLACQLGHDGIFLL